MVPTTKTGLRNAVTNLIIQLGWLELCFSTGRGVTWAWGGVKALTASLARAKRFCGSGSRNVRWFGPAAEGDREPAFGGGAGYAWTEGALAGNHFEENEAKSIDVRGGRDGFTVNLLRRHISQRAGCETGAADGPTLIPREHRI